MGECRRMESVERTHTSLIGPGRSHSRPVFVFSYHGRLVAQVVAAERVRGRVRPRCSRWVSTMANQVPGGKVGWPSHVARRHRRSLGLRSKSCTSSRWAKGRVVVREISNGNVHGRPQSSAAKAFLPFHDRQPGPGVVTGEVTVGMRGWLSPGRTRLATGKLQSECTCTLHLTAHEQIMIDGEPCPPHKTSRALKVTTLGHCPYTKSRLRCLSGPERSVIPCCPGCWGQHSLRSEVERKRNWHFCR